ncbi:MAG: rhomboid family intramembrane serine protease [Gemmatimonadaceae bacterium]
MTPWVTRLLAANVGMFALQAILPLVNELFVFIPRLVLYRPWTVVTYMFLHGGFTHLLFNMLVLFFFGSRVESRLGSRRFLILYFLSGITGAIASLIFTPNAGVIGASAGMYGVMMAFAMFWPRERIYIWGVLPIEARVLVILTTGFALYAGFGGGSGGVAHFAHLGGYVGAVVYLWWLRRNSGASQFRRQVEAVTPVARRVVGLRREQLRLDGVHEITREEVDRILDKITAEGMASLTPQELQFLSNFAPMDDRR